MHSCLFAIGGHFSTCFQQSPVGVVVVVVVVMVVGVVVVVHGVGSVGDHAFCFVLHLPFFHLHTAYCPCKDCLGPPYCL